MCMGQHFIPKCVALPINLDEASNKRPQTSFAENPSQHSRLYSTLAALFTGIWPSQIQSLRPKLNNGGREWGAKLGSAQQPFFATNSPETPENDHHVPQLPCFSSPQSTRFQALAVSIRPRDTARRPQTGVESAQSGQQQPQTKIGHCAGMRASTSNSQIGLKWNRAGSPTHNPCIPSVRGSRLEKRRS